VGHLDAGEHACGGHTEVQVGEQLGGGGAVQPGQLTLAQLVRVQAARPRLDVHHVARLLRLQQLDHLQGGGMFNQLINKVHKQETQDRSITFKLTWENQIFTDTGNEQNPDSIGSVKQEG
jgi:hypothetical protein